MLVTSHRLENTGPASPYSYRLYFFTSLVPDASMPSTSARAIFPDPIKPTLYPTPAFAAGSVPRRLLDGGGPDGVLTAWVVCGADDLREDKLGVVTVRAALEMDPVADGVFCDDILFPVYLMT